MIYYFLPGPGIFGGIKVGYQFTQLLNELGLPAAVAAPRQAAAQWFESSVPVVDEAEALRSLKRSDRVLFSLPHDYLRLKATGVPLVFHCQGTDPLIDPILEDPDVIVLACWQQAADYVRQRAERAPIEVGIAISNCFFQPFAWKCRRTVACMPRRGPELIQRCQTACPELEFVPIAGRNEREVSERMRESSLFLASAAQEWFGLPALEAMAAGCVVVSVPVLGGNEYLQSGRNCLVAESDELPDYLHWIADPAQDQLRASLRQQAQATAFGYRLSRQRQRLRRLLEHELEVLRS